MKCSLVFPVRQADPLQAEFVIPIKWVRDETVAQQIGVHYARNLCGMPLLYFWFIGISDGTNLPIRVQGLGRRLGGCERRRYQQQKDEQKECGRSWTANESRSSQSHN